MFVRMVILLKRTSHFMLSTVTKKPDSFHIYIHKNALFLNRIEE